MDYITTSDLDTFLGDEKTRLSSAGITAERYAQTVADVNQEVGLYVGSRTLSFVPGALRYHACAIARYRLYRDKASEKVKEEHDVAQKFFKQVLDGSFPLPVVDDPATPENESSSAGVWFSAQPSKFTGRGY